MFWNRDRKGWVTSEQATRYKTKAVACLATALLPTGAKVIEARLENQEGTPA